MDSFYGFLIHTCDVYRYDKNLDAIKNPNPRRDLVMAGVQCRIKSYIEKPTSSIVVGGYIVDADYKCYTPATFDEDGSPTVKVNDEIQTASQGVVGTYLVLHVGTPVDDVGVHHFTLFVKKQAS